MRVLGLIAASGPLRMAVLETDGRTLAAFGPASRADSLETAEAFIADQAPDLVGLVGAVDADALARRTGVPVAYGFDPFGPLKAVYYRALARERGLQRPVAVADGERTVLIAANGLLSLVEAAPRVVRAQDLRPAEALDAEAAAFLAMRYWNGQPVAFPRTTGAPYPMAVGRIARPQ